MTGPLGIVTLALADSINPIAIGMVVEALLVRRAIRQAVIFALTTFVVNVLVAWALIQGFDLISGLQQTIWPTLLIAVAGLALIAQGIYDAIKARRHPEAKTRLWFSIAGAGAVKTAIIAIVVSVALLPFGGQIVVAMLQVSAMGGGALVAWGWAALYSALYTLPLWALIGLAYSPLSGWRPKSPLVTRYGAATASIFFGLCLLALALLS